MRINASLFAILMICSSCLQNQSEKSVPDNLMIRMAEIEVYPEHLEQYLTLLKEESAASVRLEPGVISIYPMFQKEQPAQIRLLEIYRDKEAYESHLQTPHFIYYKTASLEMVKSLRLVEMEAIDPNTMPALFRKLEP
jgi:quinol monooxygenase YgiN